MAEKLTPVLMIVVVALAFITGSLFQRVQTLENGGGTVAGTTAGNQPAAQPQEPFAQLPEEAAKKFPEVSSFTISSGTPVKVTEGEHLRGSANAEVFLVEYSDLQCPFCSTFHATAQQAMDEYGDKIAWVYRHFPLDSIHPQARPAALGSECVASLGGEEVFWKFVDTVFADQQGTLSKLSDVAVDLGIDKGAYETCVASGSFAQQVEDDSQSGLDAGVNGTPGNFLVNRDGKVWQIQGAVPYTNLKEAIEEALN